MRDDVDPSETDEDEPVDDTPVLLGPDGKPVKAPRSAACPRCGAGPKERLTAGFGRSERVVCSACGYRVV